MSCIIKAEFEYMDTAENAARNLREMYPEVSYITLKAKSINDDDDLGVFPVFPLTDSAPGFSGYVAPAYSIYNEVGDQYQYNGSYGRSGFKNDVILETEVEDSLSHAVSGLLRNRGGLNVHIDQDKDKS